VQQLIVGRDVLKAHAALHQDSKSKS